MKSANSPADAKQGFITNKPVLALLAGLSLIAIFIACIAASRQRQQQKNNARRQSAESPRDRALKETFPASDAPASEYFDIPSNRM